MIKFNGVIMKRVFTLWVLVLSITGLLTGCGGGGGGGSMPVPSVTGINGGISGSGTVGSIFVIDGNGFGDLSTVPSAGYSVDFRDATTNDILATADMINGVWSNIFIKGKVPNLAAGTIYKVTVTTPGGTSNAVSFLIVAGVAFSPSTITWSQTSALPVAQQGFPTVIAPIFKSITSVPDNYIYAIGGNTATSGTVNGKASNVATVNFNRMDNANGALDASWAATTSLPAPRGFAAAVIANSFNSLASGNNVYLLGGLDALGNATSTVYYASINDDGTAGTWATTTALPQTLFAEGAVIFHGRIYVAGGNDSTGAPVSTVYSAKIMSDGALDSWQTLSSLPVPLAYHQLVTSAGYLYVIGGNNVAVDPLSKTLGSAQDTVYYNQIDLQNGSLVNTAWTTNDPGMGKAREKFTAVVAGSNIVVTGGLYSGQAGSSESRYGEIKTDGSVKPFAGATGTNTIHSDGSYDPYNHSTAYFVDASGNPHVLILGGGDVTSGDLHSEVWYQH